MKVTRLLRLAPLAVLPVAAVVFTPGCATNPVTGERELAFIGEGQEVAMGRQAYQPTKQAEGGPYVTMPELTAYVSRVGERIAKHSDRPDLPYEFAVLNNPTPNAWALPGGKIAINRGLLTTLENEAELAAVLAHEIVHAAARHGAQRVERAQVGGALATIGMVGLDAALGEEANREQIMGLAHTSASLGLQLVSARYSRDAEFEADEYGIEYMVAAGYDPQAAVSLQRKFLELSKSRRSGLFDKLFASHPPSQARVEANQEIAAEYKSGGELGRERYQRAIADLQEAQPAYEAYRQGIQAFRNGDLDTAIAKANKAQQIEPREAEFFALEARAKQKQNRPEEALEQIRMAINRNDQFFAYHMMEGEILQKLGRTQEARAAFAASQNLLPTAEGAAALGFTALEMGDERRAEQALAEAAAYSGTEAGQRARAKLVDIRLQENPGQFFAIQALRSDTGGLLLRLQNRAPVALEDIRLRLRSDALGVSRTLTVERAISSGQTTILTTGIGKLPGGLSPARVVTVQVVEAAIAASRR